MTYAILSGCPSAVICCTATKCNRILVGRFSLYCHTTNIHFWFCFGCRSPVQHFRMLNYSSLPIGPGNSICTKKASLPASNLPDFLCTTTLMTQQMSGSFKVSYTKQICDTNTSSNYLEETSSMSHLDFVVCNKLSTS